MSAGPSIHELRAEHPHLVDLTSTTSNPQMMIAYLQLTRLRDTMEYLHERSPGEDEGAYDARLAAWAKCVTYLHAAMRCLELRPEGTGV